MTKEDLASLLIGARVMSLAEFRALLARLGFVRFEPAPFDVEQMNEVADALLVAEKESQNQDFPDK